jgi:Ca2+-binding RTX toxin-like protein
LSDFAENRRKNRSNGPRAADGPDAAGASAAVTQSGLVHFLRPAMASEAQPMSAHRRCFSVESLEPRRLLAAAPPTLADGLLRVWGSIDPDEIRIAISATDATRLVVTVNDIVNTFPLDSVERIRVELGQGDDEAIVNQLTGVILQPIIMLGGLGADILSGGNGRDNLLGGDGDDILSGAGRADTLDGGDGEDNLFGGARRDLLLGGLGQDLMLGGLGGDTLRGGLDADFILGGIGADLLEGQGGADYLLGQLGIDIVRGGDGDDDLTGGLGIDLLFGGDGNDDFFDVVGEILDFFDDAGENLTNLLNFRD